MITGRIALRTVLATVALSAAVTAHAALIEEGFDAGVPGNWVVKNNSNPVGQGWLQGNPAIFTSHSGADDSYVAASFLSTDPNGGAVSNWLLTPEVSLSGSSSLTFFTRTEPGSIFPDALEVRLSTAGASTDVGATAASVGDFTTLLLAINPTLVLGGYPDGWTSFTVALPTLGVGASGRIAFRYLVDDTSINGNYIGIDSVHVPEPMTMTLVGLGLVGLAARRRQS